jgi:RNA polymerase subunit RPABC4/transcription elongation factor Spt4
MLRETACQQCNAAFDWHESACPNCGWDRSAWAAGGRYGLQMEHTR